MKRAFLLWTLIPILGMAGCQRQPASDLALAQTSKPDFSLDYGQPRGDMCEPDSESFGDYYCQDGEMHLVNTGHSGWAGLYFNIPGNSDFKNFILQASMHSVGEAGWYGVQFRMTGANNGYIFLVDPAGSFQLLLDSAGNLTNLLHSKHSPAIHKGEAVNVLQVIARGNQFTLFANAEELASADGDFFSEGMVGVLAMYGGHAAVARLSVWELP